MFHQDFTISVDSWQLLFCSSYVFLVVLCCRDCSVCYCSRRSRHVANEYDQAALGRACHLTIVLFRSCCSKDSSTRAGCKTIACDLANCEAPRVLYTSGAQKVGEDRMSDRMRCRTGRGETLRYLALPTSAPVRRPHVIGDLRASAYRRVVRVWSIVGTSHAERLRPCKETCRAPAY